MRRGAILLIAIALASLAALAAISWIAADSIIHPERHTIDRTPQSVGLSFEDVGINSSDGTRLAAWWVPTERPRGTVIVLHGFGSNRSALVDHLPYLHDAGYDLLLYDARGCGESGGEISTLGWREQDDLRASIDLAVQRSAGRPIMALGFSLGAATAILEGAGDPRLRAIVADASFSSVDDTVGRAFPHFTRPSMPAFPFALLAVGIAELRIGRDSDTVRPIDAVGDLAPRPVLLISGTDDELVALADADRLWAAAGEGAERWVVPGGAHPGSSRRQPFRLEPVEFRRRVLALFERGLGQAP